ncbi:MAG: DUF2971 domain-containing protein [Bacteroidota bacterium]|nr:DUF2971 domain-containing protein [Bacteroidota bacterium]
MKIKEIQTVFGTKRINMVPWESKLIPEKLFKYRDWKKDYHRNILLHQEIFIPSPRTFNDPFDCQISIAFHLLKYDENLVLDYFNKVVRRHFPNYSTEQHNQEVIKLLKEGRYKNDAFIFSQNKQALKKIHDTLGVFSVTAVNDNVLMWAHYSNNHSGFCVGFDSVQLFSYLGGGGEIFYEKDYPTILPTEDFINQMLRQTNTKASYWNYEIEYRLTKMNGADSIIIIPKEIITDVILGYKISKSDERDIIKIISLELPHVKVYKTKPKDLSFEFDLIELF